MNEPDLDWGKVTPEAFRDENREALHVLNVKLVGEENRNRVLKFVVARVLHFHRQLPEGSSQRIRFDLRGQQLSDKSLESVRRSILDAAAEHRIHASVEFLTN